MSERVSAPGEPARFHGRLLVVDDDENNRHLLTLRLQMEGHRIESAENGRQAIDRIEHEDFDLILLDVMMPEVNGIDVLRIIRQWHSPAELPVIMITARDESHEVADTLRLGANDYITKPLDMVVLLARIQTQLGLVWHQQESARLQALKEEFIAIASHDLKSPLSHVLGYGSLIVELMASGEERAGEVVEFAQRIVEAARTMRRIVDDFLDFQALEEGQFHIEWTDGNLNTLALEVLEAYRHAAGRKEIDLLDELDPGLPTLAFDAARIRQVIQNLVDNAIKFCLPRSTVRLRTFADGDRAVLEVVDAGPGLTEEDERRVFTRYARLSNRPTGDEKSSGLGLAIARLLVESHGGTIGVRNNDDIGATFWFSLPLHPADEGRRSEPL